MMKPNPYQHLRTISFKLVTKEHSKLMKLIGWLLSPINKHFNTSYITTIGTTIYAPGGLISEEVLMHELKHVDDFRRYHVWFIISYLLLFPLGPGFRAFWEWRAYKISLYYALQGLNKVERDLTIEYVISQFTTSLYGWMWPFPNHLRRVINEFVKELEDQGHLKRLDA